VMTLPFIAAFKVVILSSCMAFDDLAGSLDLGWACRCLSP